MRIERKRLDVALVDRGLAKTRNEAQGLILAGSVFIAGQRVDKAGTQVLPDAVIEVRARRRYVSRGGDKLASVLPEFLALGLVVADAVALDVGASTGGFTDCLLQHGAAHVFAIDVGYGQLDDSLRKDPRVTSRERFNARSMTVGDFDKPIQLVVVDASFIGLELLLAPMRDVLVPGGSLIALIKPQFEVGKEIASKTRGVIRDEAVREAAIARVCGQMENVGFAILGAKDSDVSGPKGNVERFVYGKRV